MSHLRSQHWDSYAAPVLRASLRGAGSARSTGLSVIERGHSYPVKTETMEPEKIDNRGFDPWEPSAVKRYRLNG